MLPKGSKKSAEKKKIQTGPSGKDDEKLTFREHQVDPKVNLKRDSKSIETSTTSTKQYGERNKENNNHNSSHNY